MKNGLMIALLATAVTLVAVFAIVGLRSVLVEDGSCGAAISEADIRIDGVAPPLTLTRIL